MEDLCFPVWPEKKYQRIRSLCNNASRDNVGILQAVFASEIARETAAETKETSRKQHYCK